MRSAGTSNASPLPLPLARAGEEWVEFCRSGESLKSGGAIQCPREFRILHDAMTDYFQVAQYGAHITTPHVSK